MKFALLLLVGFLGIPAEGKLCHTRPERMRLRHVMTKMTCHNPTEQLVTLPVPEGYDYVMPSMEEAMQCSGLMCYGMNKGCIATKTKPKTFKVEAKRINGVGTKCTEVTVDEHVSCGCGCTISEDQCRKDNMVLDERKCSCVCSKEAEALCNSPDGSRMWDNQTCSCICTHPEKCPRGAFWIEEKCSCMQLMQRD